MLNAGFSDRRLCSPEGEGSSLGGGSQSSRLPSIAQETFAGFQVKENGSFSQVTDGILSRVYDLNDPVTSPQVTNLLNLIAQHPYVSFRLNNNGEALHIIKDEDSNKLQVSYVRAGALEDGTRFSKNEAKTPDQTDAYHVLDDDRLNKLLDKINHKLIDRGQEKLKLHLSTQGYHEVTDSRLVMGDTDTGGQNAFMKDLNLAEAAEGKRVINVNNGGPNAPHPQTMEMREGMHYDLTRDMGGVDLFFANGTDHFIEKESMYERDGYFERVADQVYEQLKNEQRFKDEKKIYIAGHYADGGAVAIKLKDKMLHQDDIPHHVRAQRAKNIVTAWYQHSLAIAKGKAIGGEKAENYDMLKLAEREECEREILEKIDIVYATSPSLEKCTLEDYDCDPKKVHIFNPGVNKRFIQRFARHVFPGDELSPHQEQIAKKLSEFSRKSNLREGVEAISAERLKSSRIIMEISRTAYSKGKMLTLQAFHKSLDSLSDRGVDQILVMTMPRPYEIVSKHFNSKKSAEDYESKKQFIEKAYDYMVDRSNDLYPELKRVRNSVPGKDASLELQEKFSEDFTKLLDAIPGEAPEFTYDELISIAKIMNREDFHVACDVRNYLEANPVLKSQVIFQQSWKTDDWLDISEISTAFITSSLSEPWGMSPLEAAAAGLFILASDHVPSVYKELSALAEIVPMDTEGDLANYVDELARRLIALEETSDEFKDKVIEIHKAVAELSWESKVREDNKISAQHYKDKKAA